jgi:nicotinate-nucleotide--dimethylbenzimidazole phosphoribosyltransferase
VTTDLPTEIVAVVERIETPADVVAELPHEVTGELRALLAWWYAVAGDCAPHPALVDAGSEDWTDASAAMIAGVVAADAAIDSGANVLVPRLATRDDVAARTIIGVLTRVDAQALVPQPQGMLDADWIMKVTAIRDHTNRVAMWRGEPLTLLDSTPALPLAFVVGMLLAASARRTPVLLDGTDEIAAAAVADRISLSAKTWWMCGSQSTDPARRAAAERVDLTRGLPLGLSDDDGLGSESTLALLRLLTQ